MNSISRCKQFRTGFSHFPIHPLFGVSALILFWGRRSTYFVLDGWMMWINQMIMFSQSVVFSFFLSVAFSYFLTEKWSRKRSARMIYWRDRQEVAKWDWAIPPDFKGRKTLSEINESLITLTKFRTTLLKTTKFTEIGKCAVNFPA